MQSVGCGIPPFAKSSYDKRMTIVTEQGSKDSFVELAFFKKFSLST